MIVVITSPYRGRDSQSCIVVIVVARQPGSFVELRLSLSTTTSRKLTLYSVNVVTSQQSVSVFVLFRSRYW